MLSSQGNENIEENCIRTRITWDVNIVNFRHVVRVCTLLTPAHIAHEPIRSNRFWRTEDLRWASQQQHNVVLQNASCVSPTIPGNNRASVIRSKIEFTRVAIKLLASDPCSRRMQYASISVAFHHRRWMGLEHRDHRCDFVSHLHFFRLEPWIHESCRRSLVVHFHRNTNKFMSCVLCVPSAAERETKKIQFISFLCFCVWLLLLLFEKVPREFGLGNPVYGLSFIHVFASWQQWCAPAGTQYRTHNKGCVSSTLPINAILVSLFYSSRFNCSPYPLEDATISLLWHSFLQCPRSCRSANEKERK